MTKDKTTAQLQQDLDDLLLWFESDKVDLDEAVIKYKQGTEIVALLQDRLKKAKVTINKISK